VSRQWDYSVSALALRALIRGRGSTSAHPLVIGRDRRPVITRGHPLVIGRDRRPVRHLASISQVA
jgi:hypothetical protein